MVSLPFLGDFDKINLMFFWPCARSSVAAGFAIAGQLPAARYTADIVNAIGRRAFPCPYRGHSPASAPAATLVACVEQFIEGVVAAAVEVRVAIAAPFQRTRRRCRSGVLLFEADIPSILATSRCASRFAAVPLVRAGHAHRREKTTSMPPASQFQSGRRNHRKCRRRGGKKLRAAGRRRRTAGHQPLPAAEGAAPVACKCPSWKSIRPILPAVASVRILISTAPARHPARRVDSAEVR